MTSKPEFGRTGSNSAPYSAYYNRSRPDVSSPLTQSDHGTPGGEYLRRFWHPIMMRDELKDLPVAIKILGEELVIFRDGRGEIGLLHRHCMHRGTSLEYGIIAERGIVCCYHGWHFDTDGTIIDTPAEPAQSKIRDKFCQGAYPVREAHGLIFAYMGPPEQEPEFPEYDTFTYPEGNKLVPFNMHLPCNWLQVVENSADPVHTAYLHAIVSNAQFEVTFRAPPVMDFPETPLGYLSMATRRIKDMIFLRAGDVIMPNVFQVTGSAGLGLGESFQLSCLMTRWAVPVDDHNSLYIGVMHLNESTNPDGILTEDMMGVDRMNLIGQTADRPYKERQREPGDYDALVSQGAIANRRSEHLGFTDRGVILFRQLLAKGIREVEEGGVPTLPKRYGKGPVRTYGLAFSIAVENADRFADESALGELGIRAADVVVRNDGLDPETREAEAEKEIRRLLQGETVA